MTFKRLILIPVFIAGTTLAAAASAAEKPVEIISAEFGVFDNSNPRETIFEPTNVVPHREGQRYGWIIELRSSRRALSVREEYVIAPPSVPAKTTDPLSDSLNVTVERRNQVSQRHLVPVDDKIYGEWAVGPSEPAGHRHLQVIIEGQVAASFKYDVK